MAETSADLTASLPRIRTITMDDPWEWLARGWNDFLRVPGISLAYGAAFSLGGFLLAFALWEVGHFYLVMPMAAGFMIIGPIIAFGLYEVSRRLALGEPVSFALCCGAVRRARGQLSLMAGLLVILLYFWMHIALLIFLLFYGMKAPSPEALLAEVFLQPQSVPFLVVGTAAGALIAAIVFAVSAVSIPMLLDRDVGIVVAVASSAEAVRRNWQPMALWAGLIAVFSIAGIVTLFVGLAVTLPLIGYATWHAYRALIE
jgi:uncharacterized membrane protein